MRIPRRFTKPGDPYAGIVFESRVSELREGAEIVFRQENVIVPSFWSEVASDILAQKYFRRAGLPNGAGENDARQVFHRLAGAWTDWGKRLGYFSSDEDSNSFYDELAYMLAHQMAAPNSPQWFNTGLHFAYGIDGPAQGHWYWDAKKGHAVSSPNGYERPQAHACFIQSVADGLVIPNGIMDLWLREARLFKFGAGSGTNFSNLRAKGEKLSGGGRSSGVMSFLKVGDCAAGAIQSGGTTRRAAKMVCLDLDHPEIETFVDWKRHEEEKVSALVAGSKAHVAHLNAITEAMARGKDPKTNPDLEKAIRAARLAFIPEAYVDRAIEAGKAGHTKYEFPLFDIDWRSEAYQTVSGQNANLSVRVPNAFFAALEAKAKWALRWRSGAVASEILAEKLWKGIARAAWESADPGLQFETTINEWHTTPAGGPIRASNPCSEFLFLDDSGCNLASLNLLKFLDTATGEVRLDDFRHASRLWTVVLEITVAMAQYPSEAIARVSDEYRPLGLGYANLGALLMAMALPYDSDAGRAVAAALTAVLTGEAYATSAEIAARVGPFERYAENRESFLRVLRNHRRATYGHRDGYENLTTAPVPLSAAHCPPALHAAARDAWDRAVALVEKHGARNAQATAIAPTGTIGLLMDCDTTGIEPEFAVVKIKSLAGGGSIRLVNRTVEMALARLGLDAKKAAEVKAYIEKNQTVAGAPHLAREHYAIFDCARRSGDRGLSWRAHVGMMAAAQPYLSGGISKTINLAKDASIDEVGDAYLAAWKSGVKCVAVYRDGSKLSQPLNADAVACVECGA